MKNIGIFVTDRSDWTAVALFNSITRSGCRPLMLGPRQITSNIHDGKLISGNIDLSTLDAMVIRDLGPSTMNDASFRFDILCQLEELGIAVVNPPGSIARAANKYISSYVFQKNNIATPETVVTNSLDDAMEALELFGRAVFKPVFGYKGIGVECIMNNEKGILKLKGLLEKHGLAYIQDFIPNPGRDIRVFVVNKKVVGSIYRTAPAGSWINNLSQGGTARPCILTEEQKDLALRASEAIGTVYAGVDILEGDRPYVIEINGTPSGKGIFDACGVDVTAKIVEYVLEMTG